MALSALAAWDTFYVITGSAAGGLIGLTFVVIALAADTRRVNIIGLRTYVTPTIVHFGTVLALAAFLNVPRQSLMSVSLGFGTAGVAGLIYTGWIANSMARRLNEYVPVREDWLWHAIFPTLAYGVLLAMACLARDRLEQCLYGVAAVSVLLLFVGIHNAWDVAVWNSVHRQPDAR